MRSCSIFQILKLIGDLNKASRMIQAPRSPYSSLASNASTRPISPSSTITSSNEEDINTLPEFELSHPMNDVNTEDNAYFEDSDLDLITSDFIESLPPGIDLGQIFCM